MTARVLRIRALAGALGLVLGGCQTPAAVYELAEKTTANAGVFQHHLGELAGRSKELASERADAVVSMEAFNAELDSYIRRELYMREQSSRPATWASIEALMKKLAALRDEIIRIEQAAIIAEQARRQEILTHRTDLNTHAAAMRDTAVALGAIAERESTQARARFIGRFLIDARADVQTALEKGDEPSKQVKALIEKVKADLKGSAATEANAPPQTSGGGPSK
jgi:hypothetical protein